MTSGEITVPLVNGIPVFEVENRGVRFKVDLSGAGSGVYGDPGWWLMESPEFEPETFGLFDRIVTPESVVLDLGAWIGPTCFYLARKAKRVIALEPDPIAWKYLTANYTQNPWATNLTIYPVAIADRTGPTAFGGNGALGNSQSTLLVRDPSWTPGQSADAQAWHLGQQTHVHGMTITDLAEVADLSGCDFVKMDIEGGELFVLPAMRSWLSHEKPRLHLSLHWKTLTVDEATAVLKELYAVYPIVSDAEIGRTITLDEAITLQARSLLGEWV